MIWLVPRCLLLCQNMHVRPADKERLKGIQAYVKLEKLILVLLRKELFWVLSFRYLLFMNSCHTPANLVTFIGVTFFNLRMPRFFVGSDNIRRCSEDFRRCDEEFCLTQTQEHKGTLTSLLKKENSEKVDHLHRLFFSLFGSALL